MMRVFLKPCASSEYFFCISRGASGGQITCWFQDLIHRQQPAPSLGNGCPFKELREVHITYDSSRLSISQGIYFRQGHPLCASRVVNIYLKGYAQCKQLIFTSSRAMIIYFVSLRVCAYGIQISMASSDCRVCIQQHMDGSSPFKLHTSNNSDQGSEKACAPFSLVGCQGCCKLSFLPCAPDCVQAFPKICGLTKTGIG